MNPSVIIVIAPKGNLHPLRPNLLIKSAIFAFFYFAPEGSTAKGIFIPKDFKLDEISTFNQVPIK